MIKYELNVKINESRVNFDLKVKIHMNVESRGNELWTGLRLLRESRNFENIISRQRKMKKTKN